ncbi:hypothetical protein B4068_2933 [Bacillus subtilis]|nr:hypothetical protein B4068_2933 [Bacillus subtilis]
MKSSNLNHKEALGFKPEKAAGICPAAFFCLMKPFISCFCSQVLIHLNKINA